MERRRLFAAIAGPIAAAVLSLSCGETQSPVQPSPVPTASSPTQRPNACVTNCRPVTLTGAVSDSAGRPLAGASVEAIHEAGRTSSTTDERGRFAMPGTFSGPITVVATKEGYTASTRTLPVFDGGGWDLAFSLEPLGPPVNIAGTYTLTLTADRACTDFPAAARTRSYTATITQGGRVTSFLARLSDARFFSTYNQLFISTAGDYASIGIWSSEDPGLVEQLPEATYFAVAGSAGAPFGPSGFTAPFEGDFEYCPNETALTGALYQCTASARVTCSSRTHQLTLVPR
jgi:Carboxypeptidase regulatory-like domain